MLNVRRSLEWLRASLPASLILACVALSSSQEAAAQAQESWNKAQKPFHIYGNTYYVGTRGLSAVLIASPEGLVLIDGTLQESAKKVIASIQTLGFRIENVKLILNTHTHYDHAGGIAELQRASGAVVAASPASAKVLESGIADRDDPQFGELPKLPRIPKVKVIKDGETQKIGSIAITPHFTPGHAPGGTTWTWRACEQDHCLSIVYADSLSAVSAKGYLFSDPNRNPNGAKLLERSIDTIKYLPCDIVIAPHPEMVDVFGKLDGRESEVGQDSFVDSSVCRDYANTARERLDQRLAEERPKKAVKP